MIATLDNVRLEMLRRGCTKTQTNSKIVPVILDIISDTGTVFVDTAEAKEEYESLLSKIYNLQSEINQRVKDAEAKEKEITEKQREVTAYVELFNNSLTECESDRGRDIMRAAQMYLNVVKIHTQYDNTAFIIGLASILAGERINPIDKIEKLSPEMLWG